MSYIKASKLAKKGKIPSRTVRRWCTNGKLPAIKLGGMWYIDLRALLENKDLTEVAMALELLG